MKRLSVIAAFTASSCVMFTSLMMAVPARAVALGTITWSGTALSQTTLGAQVGDTFVIESNEPTSGGLRLVGQVSASGSACNGVGIACVVNPLSAAPNNVKTFAVTGFGSVDVQLSGSTVATLTISAGGGGSSSSDGSGMTPIIQQFGKPTAGTCDAAQPEGLNWARVPSGGWANSWAQWMNGGNGGFVCTRTLIYSTAQSTWIVA